MIIPSLKHTCDEWKIVKESTCSIEGEQEGLCCVCGSKIIEKLPLLAHTESDWITDVYPTKFKEGSKHIECLICGTIIETQKINKLPSDDSNSCASAKSYSIYVNYFASISLLCLIIFKKRK